MNALVPASHSFSVSDVEKVATAIAKGGLFGSKDPYAVLTLCLLAQAEGQHPAVVFRDYHIISGKPAKKAEAMLRDFINSGGKVEWHKLDDTCADATFTHPAGSARIDWTVERAKKAGISTPMWSKYPRQMLRSRVISEGVRTVYPGATSGLYVPEEVEVFDAPRAASVSDDPQDMGASHPETGEVIEARAIEQKVVGIQKIKNAIRQMKAGGNDATTLEEFEAAISHYGAEMAALENAQHSWWTGTDSDGNTFEGIPAWIERRRAELSDGMFKMLIDSMKECDSSQMLANWMATNESLIEQLDGAEGRKFEMALQLHESALKQVATVTAG